MRWRVGVGRLPFALAVSPNGEKVYVSNIGTYRTPSCRDSIRAGEGSTGLDFAPFGTGSPEAQNGVVIGGKASPRPRRPQYVPTRIRSSSSMRKRDRRPCLARVRTGLAIGEKSVGGSSPGGVAVGRDRVYVSNSAQDSISMLDARKSRLIVTTRLEPAGSVGGLRGVLPFGLTLSPDESRLYVACAGNQRRRGFRYSL